MSPNEKFKQAIETVEEFIKDKQLQLEFLAITNKIATKYNEWAVGRGIEKRIKELE